MTWWMEQAARLQAAGRESEAGKKWDEYEESDVQRAIIYTREDITMVVALLNAANHQMNNGNRLLVAITNLLTIILCALIYICYKIW